MIFIYSSYFRLLLLLLLFFRYIKPTFFMWNCNFDILMQAGRGTWKLLFQPWEIAVWWNIDLLMELGSWKQSFGRYSIIYTYTYIIWLVVSIMFCPLFNHVRHVDSSCFQLTGIFFSLVAQPPNHLILVVSTWIPFHLDISIVND